eukprot:scpid35424/ scgid0478/ 
MALRSLFAVRNACSSLRRNCQQTACYGTLKGRTVRIGCASGFWGDTPQAAPQLVRQGKIDYLVLDYLSEITMSLMAMAKKKKPEFGYAPDFLAAVIKPLQHTLKEKGIRVVANAGGVNPAACVSAIQAVLKESNVDLRVGAVSGDDLMDQQEYLQGQDIKDLYNGEPLPESLQSMNAYLGAHGIATVLGQGADIVVTGRCVDSALALGPLMHEFGWQRNDYNRLAAGSLAGHLIECGAQSTGGIMTDWKQTVDGWSNMGFPVVECAEDGLFVLTKPDDTGGVVSRNSVGEQLVYEIGDPRNYYLPDVTCDFSNVQLTELAEPNSVLVEGAQGKAPTDSLKVSATYMDGYRATVVSPVIGPRAAEKVHMISTHQLERARKVFKKLKMDDFSHVHVQALGEHESYGPHAKSKSREVVQWLAVRHKQKEAIDILGRELAAAGTGMAPGCTTLVGGRPKATPVFRLFSFLYPKSRIEVACTVLDKDSQTFQGTTTESVPSTAPDAEQEPAAATATPVQQYSAPRCSLLSVTEMSETRLEQIACMRSGDKANSSNIGVLARCDRCVDIIREQVTAEKVQHYFDHLLEPGSKVERYELPGIGAFNFVLPHSLGGGGITSLRPDPQGKGYGQMLADFRVTCSSSPCCHCKVTV